MSTRQDEIREAIRGFADHIKPDVDSDQASPDSRSINNGYPPLQQAERGGVVVHVGDTRFDKGPVDFSNGHHEHLMSRSEPAVAHEMLPYRPNLKLLIASVFLWFVGILPLYISPFLPEEPHHWFNTLGFLSLFMATATTVLGLLETRR